MNDTIGQVKQVHLNGSSTHPTEQTILEDGIEIKEIAEDF